jgi:PAS domain-containing protein
MATMTILDKLLKDPQFLPEVFEAMRDGLMVVDNKGTILLFNRAAEEITGYRKEEVIGREMFPVPLRGVWSWMKPEDKGTGNSKNGALHNRNAVSGQATGGPSFS